MPEVSSFQLQGSSVFSSELIGAHSLLTSGSQTPLAQGTAINICFHPQQPYIIFLIVTLSK